MSIRFPAKPVSLVLIVAILVEPEDEPHPPHGHFPTNTVVARPGTELVATGIQFRR